MNQFAIRARFYYAWSLKLSPNVEDFLLPEEDGDSILHAFKLCKIDVEWRVRAGERSTVSRYCETPRLLKLFDSNSLIDLANLEFQCCWRYGKKISCDNYRAALPEEISARLASMVPEIACPACECSICALEAAAAESTVCGVCSRLFHAHELFPDSGSPWCESDTPEWLRWEIINAKCDKTKRLGQGAYGSVYAINDRALFNRPMAVKVLQGSRSTNPEAFCRFEQECKLLATLQHNGIPPIHSRGVLPDGCAFLTMRVVAGETLKELLDSFSQNTSDQQQTRVSQRESLAIRAFESIAETVAFVHSKHVVHRDIKPANIYVGDLGEVFLLDFGIATHLNNESNLAQTKDGTQPHTPMFMSPEQSVGSNPSFSMDVFSLGAILCTILTGRPPWDSGDINSKRPLTATDLTSAYERLKQAREGKWKAEPELLSICEKSIAFEPSERFVDATGIVEALAFRRASSERRSAEEISSAAKRPLKRTLLVMGVLSLIASMVATAIYRDYAAKNLALAASERVLLVENKRKTDAIISRAIDARLLPLVELISRDVEHENSRYSEELLTSMISGVSVSDSVERGSFFFSAMNYNEQYAARKLSGNDCLIRLRDLKTKAAARTVAGDEISIKESFGVNLIEILILRHVCVSLIETSRFSEAYERICQAFDLLEGMEAQYNSMRLECKVLRLLLIQEASVQLIKFRDTDSFVTEMCERLDAEISRFSVLEQVQCRVPMLVVLVATFDSQKGFDADKELESQCVWWRDLATKKSWPKFPQIETPLSAAAGFLGSANSLVKGNNGTAARQLYEVYLQVIDAHREGVGTSFGKFEVAPRMLMPAIREGRNLCEFRMLDIELAREIQSSFSILESIPSESLSGGLVLERVETSRGMINDSTLFDNKRQEIDVVTKEAARTSKSQLLLEKAKELNSDPSSVFQFEAAKLWLRAAAMRKPKDSEDARSFEIEELKESSDELIQKAKVIQTELTESGFLPEKQRNELELLIDAATKD